ncbi:MAG: hypothetical protein AVDCRST_MAG69-110, partial [uncultured Solirubrobacteraceae bacterium]
GHRQHRRGSRRRHRALGAGPDRARLRRVQHRQERRRPLHRL